MLTIFIRNIDVCILKSSIDKIAMPLKAKFSPNKPHQDDEITNKKEQISLNRIEPVMESKQEEEEEEAEHADSGSSTLSKVNHLKTSSPKSRALSLWALAAAKYGCDDSSPRHELDKRRLTFSRLVSRASSLAKTQEKTKKHGRYSNSFRLEPERLVPVQQLETMIHEVLHSYLAGEDYKANKSVAMITRISDIIKQRVKDMNIPRYKIVSFVVIGQNSGQSFHAGSRCLWNSATDALAQATFLNATLFAVATVHALYQE